MKLISRVVTRVISTRSCDQRGIRLSLAWIIFFAFFMECFSLSVVKLVNFLQKIVQNFTFYCYINRYIL